MQSLNSQSSRHFNIPTGIEDNSAFLATFQECFNSFLTYGLSPKLKVELQKLKCEIIDYERALKIDLNGLDRAKCLARITECRNTTISKVLKALFVLFDPPISEDLLIIILNSVERLGFVFGRNGISKKRDITPALHKREYITNFLEWYSSLLVYRYNENGEKLPGYEYEDEEDQEEVDAAETYDQNEEFDVDFMNTPEEIFDAKDFFDGHGKDFIQSIIVGVSSNQQQALSRYTVFPTQSSMMDVALLSYGREYLCERAALIQCFTQKGILTQIEEETGLPLAVYHIDRVKEALEKFLLCAFDLSQAEISLLIEIAIQNNCLFVPNELLWFQMNLESFEITKPPEDKYLIEDEAEFRRFLHFLDIGISGIYRSASQIQILLEGIDYSSSAVTFDTITESKGEAEFNLLIHALIRYAQLREIKLSSDGNLIEIKDLSIGDVDDSDQGDVRA